MRKRQSRGVKVSAMIQLRRSEMAMTENRDLQNSPTLPVFSPMEPKARMATRVAPRRGQAVSRAVSESAFSGSAPDAVLTRYPSVMTMALSTSMPRARMSVPSETMWRSMPAARMQMNVPSMVSSSVAPMAMPERRPMVSRSTAMTIPTDSARLDMKVLMDRLTSSDW